MKRRKNSKIENIISLYGFRDVPGAERIVRYIELTDEECAEGTMLSDDLRAMYLLGRRSIGDAIMMAFTFGQAKGYRACQRKDGKHGKQEKHHSDQLRWEETHGVRAGTA